MASHPPAPGIPRDQRRSLLGLYLALVGGLLSLTGLAMPVASFLGMGTSLPCFLLAAVLASVGTLSFILVARSQDQQVSVLAWVAFPVALISVVAMVPLLIGAVFPEALSILGSPDPVKVIRVGTNLEIEFPRLMMDRVPNVELNDLPIPGSYFTDHRGRARWRHLDGARPRSILTLDLEKIRADFELGSIRHVGLNRIQDGDTPQFLDASAVRFLPQRLEVPPGGLQGPSRRAAGSLPEGR